MVKRKGIFCSFSFLFALFLPKTRPSLAFLRLVDRQLKPFSGSPDLIKLSKWLKHEDKAPDGCIESIFEVSIERVNCFWHFDNSFPLFACSSIFYSADRDALSSASVCYHARPTSRVVCQHWFTPCWTEIAVPPALDRVPLVVCVCSSYRYCTLHHWTDWCSSSSRS